MTTKHEYTLLFRGEHVQTFTTVYEEQHVLLGYRRFAGIGQSPWETPKGHVAKKPEVLRQMKTAAALKRDGVPSRFNTYPGQHFIVRVTPGVTEITDLTPIP